MKKLFLVFTFFLISSFLGLALYAHPHVFVTAYIKPNFTKTTLESIDVKWEFDEFYSATLLLEADENVNLILEKKEQDYLYKNVFSAMENSNYLLVIKDDKDTSNSFLNTVANKKFTASKFEAKYNEETRELEYTFNLQINMPLEEVDDKQFFFIDQSYYVAWETKISNELFDRKRFTIQAKTIFVPIQGWGSIPVVALHFTQ